MESYTGTLSSGSDFVRAGGKLFTDSGDSGGVEVFFALDGNDPGVSGDPNNPGTLTIAGPTITNVSSTGTLTPASNTTYTLTVTGSWATPGDQTSVDSNFTTTAGGDYFSFRPGVFGTPGTLTVDHDNFSIVPEPMSAALLGFGGLLMLRRRR